MIESSWPLLELPPMIHLFTNRTNRRSASPCCFALISVVPLRSKLRRTLVGLAPYLGGVSTIPWWGDLLQMSPTGYVCIALSHEAENLILILPSSFEKRISPNIFPA